MKSFFIAVFMVAFSMSLFAQRTKVTSAETMVLLNDVDGAKKAIDEALADPKSNTWPKTYIIAGKVYIALFNAKKDSEGLNKASGFFDKATEYDNKGDEKGKGIGKYKNEISIELLSFKNDLINAGVDCFGANDFNCALLSFENALAAGNKANISATAVIDTGIIYNCGLAADKAQNYEKAAQYYGQAVKLGYGAADGVLLLHQTYVSLGDSSKMGENLEMGVKRYPKDERILTVLINYYIDSKQDEKALDYLNKAIANEPKNPSYFYARGVLFDKKGDFEKAVSDYSKCIELDGNYFNGLYNLGVLYYNNGVELNNKANNITNVKEYEAAKAVANSNFEKALPYMEKAYSILESNPNALNSDKITVLESLKNIYYRFDKMDKYDETKAKINSLQ